MNYEDMSDFEINKAVARHEGFNVDSKYCINIEGGSRIEFILESENMTQLIDYCNNPSDAWPIIVKNGIDIEFFYNEPDEEYRFCHAQIHVADFGFITVNHPSNPLRAAMIVFLKMQESKHLP